jgi:cysteine desulfurase/selenocysteine lyase
MIAQAHHAGALTLLDAAQAVPHFPVSLAALEADFLVFSSHKMCGPTGIGALYARPELLQAMPPYQGGGDMIKRVRLDGFEANVPPYKFEAGTPPIAEAIGLKAAIEFLERIGMQAVHQHEQALTSHALDRLEEIPGLRVYGPPAPDHGGVAAFSLEGVHPHDVAQILDARGIAVRAGHHCAMPIHDRFGLPATTRASFSLYNTTDEIDQLVDGLYKVKDIFS